MYRGSGPRILPLIIIVVVVAIVIAAIVAIGRAVFSNKPSTSKNTSSESALSTAVLDRAEGRSVRWTVRGPIVANEKFKSYQITISPRERTMTIYTGYLDQVDSTRSLANNDKAYEQFVYALDNANVTKSNPVEKNDTRGICATRGLVYVFETLSVGNPDQTLWTSTCKESKGSLAADPAKIQALFVNQIPEFRPLFNEIY